MKIKSFLFFMCLFVFPIYGQVTEGEYFFNSDPGLSKGTSFTVANNNGEFVKQLDIGISSLKNGFNTIYIRVKQNDVWSAYDRSVFYKIEPKTIFNEDITIKNLVNAEYFFDTDPDIGNGINIPFTANKNILETFTVDVSDLKTGFHTIYIRAKAVGKQWSTYSRSIFYKAKQTNFNFIKTPITDAEYFFDTDPGIGKGESIGVENTTFTFTNTFNIDISDLKEGFHTIHIRVKQANLWSNYDKSQFYIGKLFNQPKEEKITKAEYFFNDFVVNGQGIDIPLSTVDASGNFETEINTTGLQEGEHLLFVRVQNEAGIWSLHDVVTVTINNDVLGTEDVSSNISLYPLPAKNKVKIQTNLQIGKYMLYSNNGKIVQKNTIQNNTLDIRTLSSGIYFLILETENGRVVKKIIKE